MEKSSDEIIKEWRFVIPKEKIERRKPKFVFRPSKIFQPYSSVERRVWLTESLNMHIDTMCNSKDLVIVDSYKSNVKRRKKKFDSNANFGEYLLLVPLEWTTKCFVKCRSKKLAIDYCDISYNKLHLLPTVARFENLTVVKVCNNRLTNLNELFKITTLVHINAAFNSIKTLEGIGCLTNLQFLNLRSNRICHIPDELANLKKLEVLAIGRNYKIDKFDFSLIKLQNLDVLSHIPSLGVINLADARLILRTLPIGFSNLINLRDLDLQGNNVNYLNSDLLALIIKNRARLAIRSLKIHEEEYKGVRTNTLKKLYTNSLNREAAFTLLCCHKYYRNTHEFLYNIPRDIIIIICTNIVFSK